MARLAIKGLPYFKITEVTSENKVVKNKIKNYAGNIC
jgi:hypothetical protein